MAGGLQQCAFPPLASSQSPLHPFSSGGDFVEPLTSLTALAWEYFGPWNGVGANLDLGFPMGMFYGGLYLQPLPQNQCVLPSQACFTRIIALQVDGNPVFSEASSRGVCSPRKVVTAAGEQIKG